MTIGNLSLEWICAKIIVVNVGYRKNLLLTILEAKASNLIDDVDFDDNDDETDDRNIDVHDEYDINDELNSNGNNMNYESDYRPSASVAQLVKERAFSEFSFITTP